MRLGRVSGTVHATVKDAQLTGRALLLVDVTDGSGKVLEPARIAVDTCGAGVGDVVMITEGSAARLPTGMAGAPVDAAIVAVIDSVSVEQ